MFVSHAAVIIAFVHFIANVSTTFTEVVLEACLLPTVLPDKFGLDCTMLVAIMHSHIGNEVGEYIDNRNTCTQVYTHTRTCTHIYAYILTRTYPHNWLKGGYLKE